MRKATHRENMLKHKRILLFWGTFFSPTLIGFHFLSSGPARDQPGWPRNGPEAPRTPRGVIWTIDFGRSYEVWGEILEGFGEIFGRTAVHPLSLGRFRQVLRKAWMFLKETPALTRVALQLHNRYIQQKQQQKQQ